MLAMAELGREVSHEEVEELFETYDRVRSHHTRSPCSTCKSRSLSVARVDTTLLTTQMPCQ